MKNSIEGLVDKVEDTSWNIESLNKEIEDKKKKGKKFKKRALEGQHLNSRREEEAERDWELGRFEWEKQRGMEGRMSGVWGERKGGEEQREGENGSKKILIIEESIEYSAQWMKIDHKKT